MDINFKKTLADIRPDPVELKTEKPSEEERLAEKHGFKSREAVKKLVRKREAEPTGNLNIRPPVSTFNRFVQWAMDNRYSYPEALKELMDKAGID